MGEEMGGDDVLDIDSAEEILIGLDVVIGIGLADVPVVVFLGEKSRRSEHDAWQPLVPVEQLAKVLGSGLGNPVDILGDGSDILSHPGRGRPGWWHKGIAEDAGRAREDERPDTRRNGLLQQVERAGDVGVDEILPLVRTDVGLVQGGGMKDRLHAGHGMPNDCAIGDRADERGEARREDVETDRLVSQISQDTHHCLAEMTRASGYQSFHARLTRSPIAQTLIRSPSSSQERDQTISDRAAPAAMVVTLRNSE